MSIFDIIQRLSFNTYLSLQTCEAHRLGTSGFPARALRQARLRAGILAAMTALAVVSASNTIAFSAGHNQGVAAVSEVSVSFGSVPVNTTSAPQNVTLQNTGSANLSISSLEISGTYASRFGQANNCGNSLAPEASCTISLTFTPNTTGSRSATLNISTNGWGGRKNVGLSGTGVAPSDPTGSVSPGSLSFGNQPVGTTSATETATLSNTGTGALSISSLTITGANAGDFAQSNSCGSSLPAGSNCTLSVSFTPTASGSRTASVSIADNASGSPQKVSLSGTGAVAAASLSPTSLSFGNQSLNTKSGTLSATLTNSSGAALNITAIELTGNYPNQYIQTNNCGTSVAVGATCTISVQFAPINAGSITAAVTLIDNASNSPQSVSLSGTGTSSPSVSLSPASLSFGNEAVSTTSGALTATLTNSGGAALSLSGIALTGTNAGDFAETNTCGSSVAAGGNCTISVTFDPTASGSRTASISITDNATGSPQALGLSGTGTTATVSLSPTSLSFGSQAIAITSSTQTVTLTNGGNTALNISSLTITGTNAADFADVANTCGSSVAAGANCTIAVAFTPSTCNSETASITVTDNGTGSPQTVSLSGSGMHNVNLSWTASSGSGIMGYNIYRGATSGGESSSPLNSAPVGGTGFTDEGVTAGSTYYYIVTAVGADDVQSSASGETSTTVPSN